MPCITRFTPREYAQHRKTLTSPTARYTIYTGGCNGNLKALGAMCEGASAEEVIRRLSGITCGYKATSCSDQLARLLQDAMKKKA